MLGKGSRPESPDPEWSLTADHCACMERLRDLRVHGDLEVILDREVFVALLHLGLNPICKGLADHTVDHVAEPLPIDSSEVLRIGQKSGDFGVAQGLIQDFGDRERRVMRHEQISDLATGHVVLVAHY